MNTLELNALAIALLGVNLAASISYFIIYGRAEYKEKFFNLPKILQKAYVGLFAGPLFIAPFIVQTTFAECRICQVAGIVLAVTGFAFIFSSFLRIGFVPSIKKEGGLSMSGAYGIVRHPIYCGTILVFLGFTLLNHSLITLLYLPISVLLYYRMAALEEKDLAAAFGSEYRKYQEKVRKKIIPFFL